LIGIYSKRQVVVGTHQYPSVGSK